jgi:hypothetical protein
MRYDTHKLEAEMIVKLTYTNQLPVSVLLRNNMGQGQPVLPRQTLEMTFELRDEGDNVGNLILIAEPHE